MALVLNKLSSEKDRLAAAATTATTAMAGEGALGERGDLME